MLADLATPVSVLTGGNLVQNAAVAPAGVGARLPVPRQGLYRDGKLAPKEFVDIDYVICQRNAARYRFEVDVEARIE